MVEGQVSRGLEPVREVFIENFARRGELGGACCAYLRGAKVVDLWGGVRTKLTGELTRSLHRSERMSTSDCRRRSRTLVSQLLPRPSRLTCCSGSRFEWHWRK